LGTDQLGVGLSALRARSTLCLPIGNALRTFGLILQHEKQNPAGYE
jgi:hypothetical protein